MGSTDATTTKAAMGKDQDDASIESFGSFGNDEVETEAASDSKEQEVRRPAETPAAKAVPGSPKPIPEQTQVPSTPVTEETTMPLKDRMSSPETRGRSTEPSRSVSFVSPKAAASRPTTIMPRSRSSDMAAARRRMHDVDGRPLDHWNQQNFEKKRDETCRVVYEPKEGKDFFQKNLPLEDYEVMKSISLEQPYYSKYNRFFPRRGHFCCKGCGNALYAAMTKFDAEDGWPAFGACVEGAVGLISSEKRQAEIEREDQACIKLQAFVRGILCRMRVTKMLEEMIQEMLQERQARDNPQGTLQQAEPTANEDAVMNFQVKSPLFSPTAIKKKVGKTKGLRYTLLRALGDDYTEIHCHRCKVHLGDVMEDDNIGRVGQLFEERHRVNGRALKYVEENLPKRINSEFSLLFADATKRRLLGLPSPKKKADADMPLRTVPFLSPRAQRKKFMSSSGIASDPLSASCHASVQGNGRRKKGGFDSLSVSCHGSETKGQGNGTMRRMKKFDPLSVSCHEASMPSINERPTGRRGKVRGVNLAEKRASLEQFILSKSQH